jgi:hypothetical protein
MKQIFFQMTLGLTCLLCACRPAAERQIISLNGEWQIAKTDGEVPDEYTSVTPVPGLVDMAVPTLDAIAMPEADAAHNENRPSYGYREGWYWHRRSFDVPCTDGEVIRLKIFKARYHTKVYVNGQFAGENVYCFTPSYFDLKPFLKKGSNEIVIGIGCYAQLPDSVPNGHDFEKLKYIPGIYDNVEITFSSKPFIENIQCVPNIKDEKLRVVAEIDAGKNRTATLSYSVKEKRTGREVAAGSVATADFEIPMKDAALWTPETPFLYELTLWTGADCKRVNFGMRTFRFDAERKIALLNEQPFYLRGTNVCIFRFFEDPDRNALPWDAAWTVKLHERFKEMHWEMARYCIGFPPEYWYEVCDSIGFMLQDEFPLWEGSNASFTYRTPQIAEEYRRWMRERWNHPSVVIWDGQNETVTPRTAEAFRQVRDLDLSSRPWENGWSEPDRPTDPVESHPYLFNRYMNAAEPPEGYKKELLGEVRRPDNDASQRSKSAAGTDFVFPNPSIINEYGWIWLNRDGSPTTLTDQVYETLWQGSTLTAQQRLYIYARHLAMLTEYWRAHRRAAGVLHFCGLAYSRSEAPRGQTSDHFTDIQNLTFDPAFCKYVRPAFAPVGLMIDVWEKSYPAASGLTAPVYIINDRQTPREQGVILTLQRDGQKILEVSRTAHVDACGVTTVPFEVTLPAEPGDYLLEARLPDDPSVFSLRDIPVRK